MPTYLDWLLPPGASTFVGEIDWRYRARPGRRAHYTHGNMKAEVIWTSVTAVVVVWVGLASAGGWHRIKGYDSVPEGALPLSILAKQFEWHVTYPGADGKIGG